MPKNFRTIQWQEPSNENVPEQSNSLANFCQDMYPAMNKNALSTDVSSFSSVTTKINIHFQEFTKHVQNLPLLSAIVFWIENVNEDKFQTTRNAEMMKELINEGLSA